MAYHKEEREQKESFPPHPFIKKEKRKKKGAKAKAKKKKSKKSSFFSYSFASLPF